MTKITQNVQETCDTLWELESNLVTWAAELRSRAGQDWRVQILREGEPALDVRRFRNEAEAIAWAELRRREIASWFVDAPTSVWR